MITSIQYNSNAINRTAFSSASNLNSLASGAACALGVVDNSSASVGGADGFFVDVSIVLASSGVSATGTLVLYLIQSMVSTSAGFTDGISPSGSSVASSIKNAVPVATLNANANSQTVAFTFRLPVADPAEFWSIVVSNQSGAALASSGHTADFTPFTYQTQ